MPQIKIEKAETLVANLRNIKLYVILFKTSKNHRLVLIKCIKSLNLLKKARIKLYNNTNTCLRKEAKNNFERKSFLSNEEIMKNYEEFEKRDTSILYQQLQEQTI